MMRPHSAPWGGKCCARDGASQVVIRIGVAAGKMGTTGAEDRLDLNSGAALREQVLKLKIVRCSSPAAESVPEHAIAAYNSGRSRWPPGGWFGHDQRRSSEPGRARPEVVQIA